MPNTLNKIQRGFSKSASGYDRYSNLHREIADKLLACVIKGPKPSVLLDVGCGTGCMALKAKQHFPQCKVIGLDFAQGMLDVARLKHHSIDWILGDCHDLPFSDGQFDILISNLSYQWAGDLPRAFSEARRVLVPHGGLACTLFGYNTCQELFQSLDEAKAQELQFSRLPRETQVRKSLLHSGFTDFKVDSEQIKIEFKDMHGLLAWLKSIGANHLSREGYLGAETMSRAASIYHEKFSYLQGVGATFEVIQVYAKK